MASYTLTGVFPRGTAVGVYAATNWNAVGLPPRGAPVGSQTTAATVDSGGSVSFTGLADGTGYFAAAQVRGAWVYEGFTTPIDFTPLTLDARLDAAEASLAEVVDERLPAVESSRLLKLAYDPEGLLVGALTRDAYGALTGASAVWPDGATGTYAGTASTAFPGSVDAYTITHVVGPTTTTYTQPAVTRNGSGDITTRPAITVA